MSTELLTEPVPDELCLHVELGEEMTGGWYFAAEDPPKAVGMCHECVVWCKENFDPLGQESWTDYAESRQRRS